MIPSVKVMVINHVDVSTILGKSVCVKLLGDAPAFHFKVTGCSTFQDIESGNAILQSVINGYDSEGLDLSINVNDIKHIYGG